MDGSAVAGSVKEAAWPMGTSRAGPMAVPGRNLYPASPPPGGEAWPGQRPAAGGRLGPSCLPAVPPAGGQAAASPPVTRPTAATAAVIAPLSTTSRRLAARPGPACLSARSAMAASSDRTEPEPASSSGVQANANTMSAPV